jgi:transcriptional regulator with XRE-family HTH domain
MLSAIESGRQDPRHSTVERILKALDHELDIVMLAGDGVDRTQFVESLKATPAERLATVGPGARWLKKLRNARRIG